MLLGIQERGTTVLKQETDSNQRLSQADALVASGLPQQLMVVVMATFETGAYTRKKNPNYNENSSQNTF